MTQNWCRTHFKHCSTEHQQKIDKARLSESLFQEMPERKERQGKLVVGICA